MEQLKEIITPALFTGMIRIATPLALAAIGGTICERSGIVNIALEGLILIGAFVSVVVSYFTGSAWLGVLGAVIISALFSLLLAYFSINLRANQVIVGTAINIFALGATGFLTDFIFKEAGATPGVAGLNPIKIPVLCDIPWIGEIFFQQKPIIYLTFLIIALSQFILFKTKIGLRIRAVGEHPRAADTVGINVSKIRYLAVIISGALGGLAGAQLALEEIRRFVEYMSGGRGFIALAANVFGKWTPIGSWFGSLLFGFAQALQLRIGVFKIPPEFTNMIPYILTIIVLAGAMGRATAPAALGKPYIKD